MSEDRVHRPDIKFRRLARLNEVLDKCFQHEDNWLETFQIHDTSLEIVHATLTLGQLYSPVFLPETVIPHTGGRFHHLFALTLKEPCRHFVEAIILIARITHH